MRNLVSTYVDQFRQDRQKQLKLAAVLAALAVLVAGLVFWQLHSTGVAMTNEVFCGQEEHIHDDGCYEQVLICGIDEEDHVHDDSCYETVLTCQIPEHTHTVECLMDETADVETADVWEATLPELTGNWSQDVAAIAESQLGYAESTANFVLADDGETHMGYTRYGAWYGNAYGDWDAMFASFCLNYANVPSGVVAENSGAYALAVSLNEQGLYIDTADFTPAAGDLVFFSERENGTIDRVGIIANISDDELTVIEGNSEDTVAENIYDINDADIVAFGILPDQGTPEGIETSGGDILYAASDGGVYVSVTAAAAALPEDAELSVTLIDEDSEDYAEAADAIGLNVKTLDTDEKETGMAVLDICFLLNGVEVEPSETVTVSIDAGAILPDGAENIVIRHLEETGAGVIPVLVAKVSSEDPVAEFEVESFSSFTVTWEGSGASEGTSYVVTVTAYLDGGEIDGIDNITFNSENDELDFESLLSKVDYETGDYTFSYAVATVNGSTYGSDENPLVAIEIEMVTSGGAGGPTTVFKLVFLDGSSETFTASSSTITVEAYYLTPEFSVTIQAVDVDENEDWLLDAVLSHAGDYASAEYVWTITDIYGNETQKATVSWSDETGRAFIVWSEGDNAPVDDEEFIVSVTVTLYDSDGTTVLGTASAEYILEYGDETVDLFMTYGPDQTALPEGVEVTLTNTVTNESKTYTTGTGGIIENVDIEPGIYTVTAEYTVGENTYRCSETVAFHDQGNYYINLNYYNPEILTNVPDRENWEHIDIKVTVGSDNTNASNEYAEIDITGVVIYESGTYDAATDTGNAKYTATAETIIGNDNEFQCSFYEGDGSTGTASHAISFSTDDTIKITYTLTWKSLTDPDAEVRTDTYTLIIDKDTVYPEGTYYPVEGQRAYKLYNYLYGTSYSSDAELEAAGIEEIDISGMSMMLVAAILCDSSEVTGAGEVQAVDGMAANQWGMDFAVSVDTFVNLSTNWMFDLEKTYKNHAMTEGQFTFYLYDAEYNGENTGDDGTWSIEPEGDGETGWHYVWSNETAGKGINGDSSDTMSGIYVIFGDLEEDEYYHYYILYEEQGDDSYTIYDSTVFGIKVRVYIDQNEFSETYGQYLVEATYYILTSEDGGETYTGVRYAGDNQITVDDDDYPTFHFTNVYQTGVVIQKQNRSGDELDGAQFTLVQTITDDEGDKYYYYDPDSYNEDDPDNSVWVSYNPDEAEPEPFELTSISIGTPWDGTYTLTETAAPDGYNILPAGIVFTVEDGFITSDVSWAGGYNGSDIADYVVVSDDGMTLTIVNETEARLPNTGGIGTWIYTFTGLLLIGGAASLIVYRKRRAVES